MTIWTDLQSAIEAKIISLGYTGTLAELNVGQPYEATLLSLLSLQAQLYAITSSGGGGGGGDASAANQSTQITAANLTNTNLGGVTETAPATDTASSGLNGRLQRIAQRITSLIALLPTSLGTKTAANSFAVIEASDSPLQPASTFAASTVCLTTALSEGSLALTNAKKIAMFSRTSTSFRISTTANNTINTQNFEPILSGNKYYQDGINFTGTFYFSAETLPTPITVASCTTTNGSSNVTSSNSFSAVTIGQAITGTGIPANTFVIRRAANGLSITLGDSSGNTVNATASGTVTLTFSGAVIHISRWT